MTEVDRTETIRLLNRALATEIVCMLRYRRHYGLARDVYSSQGRQRILLQIQAESLHAEAIAERIIELGGVPDLELDTLMQRSYVPYGDWDHDATEVFLPALAEDDLLAEQIAADAYRDIVADLESRDPQTCRLLSTLAVAEEAHAAHLQGLLQRWNVFNPAPTAPIA